VRCAKTDELIDLPFGLWTQVGRRKHKFNCIRQVAPVWPPMRAHWRRPSADAMPPHVKLLWPLVIIRLHCSTMYRLDSMVCLSVFLSH